jgi:acetolactate synthase-1/2/3 large subunit
MADGYARETGKLGVCCATTGPGATNMLTGVASAYMDHTPLLAITAQTSIKNFGRGAVQESSCTGINTVAMYQHCTRYNSLVSHIEQLERKLLTALTAALQPPYGPAHLSIPIDILRDTVSINIDNNLNSLLTPSNALDEKAVDHLHRTLHNARNVVFVLGAGAKQAVNKILALATLIDAHVITLPDGKGLVSAYHPQYRGIYGLAGHATAQELLNNKSIDTVLAIGTHLDEQATNGWESSSLLSKKMVFIDSTPLYFSRSPMARHHISGNISEMFSRLLKRFQHIQGKGGNNNSHQESHNSARQQAPIIPFERRTRKQRRDSSPNIIKGVSYLHVKERRQSQDRRVKSEKPPCVRHFTLQDEDKFLSDAVPIKPQRLMYDLSRLFPSDTRYFADIGNSFLWAIHYLHPFIPVMTENKSHNTEPVRLGMGFASMGWAVGAAVGTAMGTHNTPVVCISGDGAMLMGGQEITTAVLEKLPVIFVVLNDAALGTVKHGQQMAKAEPIGFELPCIDFVTYAKSMGAQGYKISSPQDLIEMDISAICKRAGPTVLDVHIDPNELPPLEQRIKMLERDTAQ